MLRLYAKFQCSTMSETGQKVCGGWCVVVGGVETYYSVKLNFKLNNRENVRIITFTLLPILIICCK